MSDVEPEVEVPPHFAIIPRRTIRFIVAGIIFFAVLNITSIAIQFRLSQDNHALLVGQIPILRARITERSATIADREQTIAEQKVTIADYKAVTDDAVGWIVKLSDQIEKLGGTPPKIILRPPKHPPPKTP